jgi:hypothetical protein
MDDTAALAWLAAWADAHDRPTLAALLRELAAELADLGDLA